MHDDSDGLRGSIGDSRSAADQPQPKDATSGGSVNRPSATATIHRLRPRASATKAGAPPWRALLDGAPVNLVFVDPDLVIRYLNPASVATLRAFAHLLPVPVEDVVDSPIEIFEPHAEELLQILADPGRLPHHALVPLGNEKLDVLVSAIHDADDEYLGAMVTWSVVTEREALETVLEQSADLLAVTADALCSIGGEPGTSAAPVITNDDDDDQECCAPDDEIGHTLGWITEVARRTKQLASDTTLEAARAGAASSGLAVLSNTVKQLARETVRATGDVRRILEEAIASDDRSVVEAIQLVGVIVQQMNHIQSTIAGAVERQTATANEIARNVGEAASGSDAIAQNVVRIVEAAWSTSVGDGSAAGAELARMTSELQALFTRSWH